MKTFAIPYGQDTLSLQIPGENWGELLSPRKVPSVSLETGLKGALGHPLDSQSLPEFLKGCRSLMIIVNDETRPTPSGAVLEHLWSEISRFPHENYGGHRDP